MQEPSGHPGMRWVNRLRLRVAMLVIAIMLAAVGAISIGPGWLALPLVGMAVAAVTVAVTRMTGRLSQSVCLTCGEDLRDRGEGEHGLICPACGSVNQQGPGAA